MARPQARTAPAAAAGPEQSTRRGRLQRPRLEMLVRWMHIPVLALLVGYAEATAGATAAAAAAAAAAADSSSSCFAAPATATDAGACASHGRGQQEVQRAV